MVMNGSIQNHFTTIEQDIFELTKKDIDSTRVKWENCVSVCIDGAPSILGYKKGFVAYMLKVNLNVKIVHCMIRREALVTKVLRKKLSPTMNEVIKIVN
jgi:hypothetical protein